MDEIFATIIKDDEGYHVVDKDGVIGPVCKLCDENDKTIVLTPNASNRKYFNRAKADAMIAECGHVDLTYKATITIGSNSGKLPNAKLISYLPQELQDEYKAIIDRAYAARTAEREANKKKPLTEKEKLMAKIAKLEAQLAAKDAE